MDWVGIAVDAGEKQGDGADEVDHHRHGEAACLLYLHQGGGLLWRCLHEDGEDDEADKIAAPALADRLENGCIIICARIAFVHSRDGAAKNMLWREMA